MQPAPLHVNQFAAGGRFPNGESSTRYDCTVAVGIMEADAATGGRVRPSATELRGAQRDQKGGIGFDDVAEALRKIAGLAVHHGPVPWGTLQARWRAGDGAGLQGSYRVVPRPETSQPGGSFGHAIYVQRYSRPGYLIVNDTLAPGPREWRESVVRNFYLSGLAIASWVTNGSSSGVSTSSSSTGGTVLSVVSASTVAACSSVTIVTPANGVSANVGLYAIPADLVGKPCIECAPGFVPALVSVGPVQTLQGFTSPENTGGAANACVREGTKPGDHPAADVGGVAGGLFAATIGPAIDAAASAFGGVFRNLLLLSFALVALLIGLYLLATAEDGGTR